MSYQLTVTGFDLDSGSSYSGSEAFDTRVSLKDALESMGAKTISYGGSMGSFIDEINGMSYKEKDGGIYTWMLSKNSPNGQESVDYGIDWIKPGDGDHFLAQYEFISNNSPKVGTTYAPIDIDLPDEIEFPEYSFTENEAYFEPETFSYDEFEKDDDEKGGLTEIDPFRREDYSPKIEEYEVFSLSLKEGVPQLTKVSIPEKVGQRRIAFQPQSDFPAWRDFELENFLMGVLSEAQVSRVLARLDAVEAESPLILA